MKMNLEKDRWLYISLVTYILISLIYIISIPLWESPDEVGHFDYIRHIREKKRLPVMREGLLGEAHQPPLYYALATLWTLPADLTDSTGAPRSNPEFVHKGQGGHDVNAVLHDPDEITPPYQGIGLALRLARTSSALFGAGTVLLTYAISGMIFPHHPMKRLLATAFVGFNPQFLFITASTNNDSLLSFLSVGLIWQTIKIIQKNDLEHKDGLPLGMWSLGIIMTKLTGLPILFISYSALLIHAIRQKLLIKMTKATFIATIIILLGSGWWFYRNYHLYGDPLGYTIYREVFRVNLRANPMTLAEFPLFFKTEFRSFWGIFGWMNVQAPNWFYNFFCGIMVAGVIGVVLTIVLKERHLPKQTGLFLSYVSVQQLYLLTIVQTADYSMWQGRYLFPIIAPLGIMLTIGLIGWMPKYWSFWISGILISSLLLLAIYTPFRIIRPAYQSYEIEEDAIEYPLNADFGDFFRLKGYTLNKDALNVIVTLFWEALEKPDFDYSVFVHLIDVNGELIGQQDHAPGASRNHPPMTWDVGEVVVDRHQVSLLRAPSGNLKLRLGVYNWATGERLQVQNAPITQSSTNNYLLVDVGQHERFRSTRWLYGLALLTTIVGVGVFWWRYWMKRKS
jgi:hypothetical protein